MKKVICAEDIEALVKQGQKTLCIEIGSILTPSAKDAAKAANLEITIAKPECGTACEVASEDEISSELIYTTLKVLQMQRVL